MNYEELREEYISLIKRSIRQKVFEDENNLYPSPETINKIFKKYNTPSVEMTFTKESSKYQLSVQVNLSWKNEPLIRKRSISLDNPSLSLFLNLREALTQIAQEEIIRIVTVEKGDLEDFFKSIEDKTKKIKEEILKIINSIPEMKNEMVFHLFLLKKEKENFSKWKETKNKRLKRIFDLQEQMDHAWQDENKKQNGEKVLLISDTWPQAGIVIKKKNEFIIESFDKPYEGEVGILKLAKETNLLFVYDSLNCIYTKGAERSVFLSDEYKNNILPHIMS